ncbi:MAG: outer membrane protein, partial [Hyphomicrobiaceae bacterium]
MTRATSSIAVLAAALATFGSADKGAAEGFAGLSVGAFVEHAWNGISFAEQMVAPPPPPPEEFGSGNLNGFGAGLLIGYDVMVSTNLLVGVVADVAVGDWEADYNVSPTLVGYYDVTYAGTIRGRIGYLFTPAMMGYVTGGYALANVRHGGRQAPTPTSISYQADGWTFG